MSKKYYIAMLDKRFGTIKYKRYKCADGFSSNKSLCWQFSKQGAAKIIEQLTSETSEYRLNLQNLEFYLEEAE